MYTLSCVNMKKYCALLLDLSFIYRTLPFALLYIGNYLLVKLYVVLSVIKTYTEVSVASLTLANYQNTFWTLLVNFIYQHTSWVCDCFVVEQH